MLRDFANRESVTRLMRQGNLLRAALSALQFGAAQVRPLELGTPEIGIP